MNNKTKRSLPTGEKLTREIAIRAEGYDESTRTLTLSFSSETPVERWGMTEILSHEPGAIDFTRLLATGSLLYNHDRDDLVGSILTARVREDRKTEATCKIGRSALAVEKLQDVQDGILRNVSVGYMVDEWKVDEKTDTWTATRWTPYEISLVTIPADITVGIGRSGDTNIKQETAEMNGQDKAAERGANNTDAQSEVASIRANETTRVREISAIGAQFGCTDAAARAIETGATVEQFRTIVEVLKTSKPVQTGERKLDVPDKDIKHYSFVRAIRNLAAGKPVDGLERELSDEYGRINNRSTGGFFVPTDILSRSMSATGDAGAKGGATIQTNVTDFIGLLENNMMVRAMGARVLTGLVGDISIPKQSGGTTAYWLTENQQISASDFQIASVAMAPKRLGAYSIVSRQLIMQSTQDVESLVREDIAMRLALALDLAAINGLGASNQPKGILHADNHTAVYAGSTPGAVAAVGTNVNGNALTWSDIVNLIGACATSNALMGSLGFLTNAKVMAQLMQTEKASGTAQFIWPDTAPDAAGLGRLGGYRAGVSNQVASNFVKGGSGATLSALIFGNWADVMIGLWGGLEINVDSTSTAVAINNQVGIVANQLCDVAIRRKESFAAIKDAVA